MTNETLKGMEDSLPSEQIQTNLILNVIKKNFEKYGFRPFDTPTIEYMDVLTKKYDDDAEIVQEIFNVTDRGKRKLGLRYDLTTPLCRFVASKKQLKLPFRRYHIGKVYRDGPLKKGRKREFIQCDGDIIGISGTGVEAEVLSMFYETYKELGINVILELNNNKILRGALLQEGFKEKDLDKLILCIDKLKKIGKNGVLKEVGERKFKIDAAEKAIDTLSCNTFAEMKKRAKSKELKEGITELEQLSKLLDILKVRYRINFSMSRGLAIYTGNIWEAYDMDENVTSSIGAGGRFDKVIPEYSGSKDDMPAVGVSFGLVPTLACLENKLPKKEGVTDILIVPLEEKYLQESLKLANKFRKSNKNAEVYYGYKLKKGFDYCDYLGIEEVVAIGQRDIENKEVVVKNLKTKKETKVDY
jgi:histidyl-tRNA synthetase